MTLPEFREKETRMCILWRKASRKIIKGKIYSVISFVILFSCQIMHMYVNIYVREL